MITIQEIIANAFLESLSLDVLQEEDYEIGLAWLNEAWTEVFTQIKMMSSFIPNTTINLQVDFEGKAEIDFVYDTFTRVWYVDNVLNPKQYVRELTPCSLNFLRRKDPLYLEKNKPTHYAASQNYLYVHPIPTAVDHAILADYVSYPDPIYLQTPVERIPIRSSLIIKLKDYLVYKIACSEAGIRDPNEIHRFKKMWEASLSAIKEDMLSQSELTHNTRDTYEL